MKLIFLTLAPLSSNAGHLARLSFELLELLKFNEISIICLGEKPDNEETKEKYKSISFRHLPIKFNGWEVVNIHEITNAIKDIVEREHVDSVILMMEVWDLIRELNKNLKGKVRFITVVHAMPFLTAPVFAHVQEHNKKSLKMFLNTGWMINTEQDKNVPNEITVKFDFK